MKVKLEIICLETTGDQINVTAQGKPRRSAAWRPYDKWRFSVPEHIGRHYRIGQKIRVMVDA